MNDILKTLTYPGVDINKLIEIQAKQQTGVVPPCTHDVKASSGQYQKRGKVYQKVRQNINKRHD